jgi:5-(carboxyamino)imidazole ribonucleotide mutase
MFGLNCKHNFAKISTKMTIFQESGVKFVSIILGSKSDYEIVKECANTLDKFGVLHELIISSAHRSPERTHNYVKEAEAKGARVFIAAAGMAAHLAGAIAANTIKPVIGIPMRGGAMDGMDAMLSTVQMPAGMPVATVAMGKAGAVNAAYLAMQILALEDNDLKIKLEEDRILKAKKVESDSADIEIRL